MTQDDFKQQLAELVKNYQPAEDVVEQLKHVSLLMIIGPSGVGKTTLINESGLRYVPSDNTRPKRPEETEGIDFYFRTDYDQIIKEIKEGRFVQIAADPEGELKATRSEFYPAAGWAVMAIVADAVPVFRTLGFEQTISAFIVPPDYAEWMRRMGSHKLGEARLKKRLAEAKRSLTFALSDPQVHFVLNDKVEGALAQLSGLLEGKINEAREQSARRVAQKNLDRLNDEQH